MSWETSIFNDDRQAGDRFQNRDSNTHMELTRDDLMNPRHDYAQWEKDIVEAECKLMSEEDN
jgi:hypothetical protein